MGHSFTTFKERHIRAKDYKVETWLFLIVAETSNVLEPEKWLLEACVYWEEEAVLSLNGCINPDFDRFLTDDHKVGVLIEICKSICSGLERHGDKISKDYLNQLCRYKYPRDIKNDVDANLFLSYGRALVCLLDGTQSGNLVYG